MCVFANIIGLCTTTGRQEPTGPKTLDSFATANGRECLRRSHRRRGADELYSYRSSMSGGSFGGRHDRLGGLRPPILVEDLDAVLGGDCAHLWLRWLGWI